MEPQGKIIKNSYGQGMSFFEPKIRKYFCLFFGNKELTSEIIQKFAPTKRLRFLKQTHSSLTINFDHQALDQAEATEGDAAFSSSDQDVLIVKTADCVPLLYLNLEKHCHGFIHAGWRGVANQILMQFLKSVAPNGRQGYMAVGPHITQKSFEVDLDVAVEILKTVDVDPHVHQDQHVLFFKKDKKFHINLSLVLFWQHEQWAKMSQKSVLWSDNLVTDVYEHQSYHSFRRDKQNSGRNLSLTMILSENEFLTNRLFLPILE